MTTEIVQASAVPVRVAGIDLERRSLILGEGDQITVHEVNGFAAVMAAYRGEGDIGARMGLLRRHRRVISPLLVDQAGGILADYATWEAIRRISGDDTELGIELFRDLLLGVRIMPVADSDEAATLIRAAHLSWGVNDEDYGRVIADQIRQQIRWIETHRAEIDARNPQYQNRPIRPSASWISQLVGVDNKRVERVYQNSAYGLEELARLPSLGSDRVVQPGVGRPRGRVARAGGGTATPIAPSPVGVGARNGSNAGHHLLPAQSGGSASAGSCSTPQDCPSNDRGDTRVKGVTTGPWPEIAGWTADGDRLVCEAHPNWWVERPGEHGFEAVSRGGRREPFGTLVEARTFIDHLYKKWWGWRRCDAFVNEEGQGRWVILSPSGGAEASLYRASSGGMRRLEWQGDGQSRELQKIAQLSEEEGTVDEDPDTNQEGPGVARGPGDDLER